MRWYKWTVNQFEGLHNMNNGSIMVLERGYGGRKMGMSGIFLVSFLAMASSILGNGGEGWVSAHATFYGGGDASGTMVLGKKARSVWPLIWIFGGVHWAILAAFISLRHPNVGLSVAVSAFFETFDNWQWPTPVTLYSGFIPSTAHISSTMPIQLPSSPGEFCQSNIARSTEQKIREEFLRGHKLTKDQLRMDFD